MRRARDDGFATVMAAGLTLLLLGVAAAVLGLGQVVLARQAAGAAADLGALSAASAALAGRPAAEACATGGRAASAVRAELVACRMVGADVVVQARRFPPEWLRPVVAAAGSPDGAVHAWARAGPGPTG